MITCHVLYIIDPYQDFEALLPWNFKPVMPR